MNQKLSQHIINLALNHAAAIEKVGELETELKRVKEELEARNKQLEALTSKKDKD